MINIEKYLESITEEQLKKTILEFCNISTENFKKGDYNQFIDFLKREHSITQYICTKPGKMGMELLTKVVNCFYLSEPNINEIYNEIVSNASLVDKRISNWKHIKIPLINEKSDELFLICSQAEFVKTNKWGYKSPKSLYKIIYNGKRIYYAGNKFSEPEYFVLKSDKIRGISYHHKSIIVFNNLEINYKEIVVKENSNLNDIKDSTSMIHSCYKDDKIDLSECFYKGFFYKGLLFDRNWSKEITILKSIRFSNGSLRIEIENLTYPHSGYVLLDLETNKIIEAMKID